MLEKKTVIKINEVSKVYHLFNKPIDRLKESLHPLGKKYHNEKYAIKNISLEVYKGDVLGILGVNGAGKSTLLKIITGVIKQSVGSVQVEGKLASLLELGAGFDYELTGYENIFLNAALNGISSEQVCQKIDDIVKFADIGEYIYQPVKNYSSGMFARLAFSTSVHFIPDILIIDEALSVGDVFFQQKCNAFIKNNLKDTTVILVTHDLQTVAKMATRVAVLDQGEIAYCGEVIDGIEFFTRLGQGVSKSKCSAAICDNKVSEIGKKQIRKCLLDRISEDKISGTLEASFDEFIYSINGKDKYGFVSPGDLVEITVRISNYIGFFENPVIGYLVSDRQGLRIFGHNTISSNFTFALEPGSTIKFSFFWPEIADNSYFITLGLGRGEDAFIHEIVCWAHNLIKLDSVSYKSEIHCLFNNRIHDFNVLRME